MEFVCLFAVKAARLDQRLEHRSCGVLAILVLDGGAHRHTL
jgi:hypothetical protein